ncbi:COG4315 family predicted lipoprotein [Jiangella alba]|uniref:Predicted lipoprotein with conserved Yx(FWY)xxD motif n=1 Tax=Jiangella alba TaxID=561176 RepID=A0A1H5KL53_9ACTN|nr:hypothetical protein [Jiangella alba]SEE65430.1 Predicted lipoprotein with conserved Yx(FWY)xxD motif [Jiangella alba]
MRISTVAVLGTGLVLALAGCSDNGGGGSSAAPAAPTSSSGSSEAPSAPVAAAGLAVSSSDLGEIVVDGKGMTVYVYTKDTQGAGTSTCSDQCAAAWPAVPAASATPAVQGVTGEVGTITGVDGKPQLTLNGWPLYTYAADQAPGDVTGEDVGEVWYVVSPAGEPIKESGDSS